MTAKNSLQEWLDKWQDEDNQLKFDFDDNMNATSQPALTISSIGIDTISLDSNYNYDYNNSISLTGGSGSYGASGTFTFPQSSITISNGTGGYGTGYGQILTTGTNGLTWADYSNVSPGLKVNGNAEFDGDVKIKGKSISETLDKIEEKLAILHPNEKLEEKWEELRELRNRYIELEKEIIEKEKMWNILKK